MMNSYLSRIADRFTGVGTGLLSPAAGPPVRPAVEASGDPFAQEGLVTGLIPAHTRGSETGMPARQDISPGTLPSSNTISLHNTPSDHESPPSQLERRIPYITKHVDRLVYSGLPVMPETNPPPSPEKDPAVTTVVRYSPEPASDSPIAGASIPRKFVPLESILMVSGPDSSSPISQPGPSPIAVAPTEVPTGMMPATLPAKGVMAAGIVPLKRIQPVLVPPAVMPPANNKKSDPAPNLVIGKITVEIIAPLKPSPKRNSYRATPVAPANLSTPKPIFGLGQL